MPPRTEALRRRVNGCRAPRLSAPRRGKCGKRVARFVRRRSEVGGKGSARDSPCSGCIILLMLLFALLSSVSEVADSAHHSGSENRHLPSEEVAPLALN